MNLTEKNIKLLRTISYASAMFSLMIAMTMIFSFMQLALVKPLENPALTELKIQYDANPNQEDLKEQIRALDLMARKAYFSTRWQIETGSYLLLFGAIVFFLCQRILSDNEKKSPAFLTDAPDSRTKKETRKYLISASVIIIVSAIVISFSMRNMLPNPTPVPVEAITEGISAIIEAPAHQPIIITNEVPVETVAISEELRPDDIKIEVDKSTIKEKPERVIVLPPITITEDDVFPFFRGQGSRGKVSSGNYPITWDGKQGTNILWKTEIPIHGYSSPIIWGDKLFLTGANAEEAAIFCFDKNTGRILWTAPGNNIPGEPSEAPDTSEDTGLAAPTAATDVESVVAIFGTGNLICLNMDGKQIWAKNIGIPDNHYGHSSSLIIHNHKILVQYDHHISKSLIAFDIKTGNKLWETKRNVALSWASPVLAVFDGITQVILSSDPFVISYDANTGEELWSAKCMSAEVGPSVGINSKYVFAANEFAKLVAIKPGKDASIVWEDNEYLPEVASPLATEHLLFVATSYGAIACYDANTGEKLWDYEFDYGFYSSPILVGDDKVYMIDQAGVMHIIKADKEFAIIEESPIGEGVVTTPAFSNGKIYIRGEKYLYCISE
ncbi:MAG: PQQ-like beta-propeller repeat protein [Bacteroidetes bacterium]|nr:PQQ-like beta-propeller repeat protein [Bacteroidota bacterium]MBL6943942.1 PQQ-like beta-propeller repeat protein [Bacteroidales bacterium]